MRGLTLKGPPKSELEAAKKRAAERAARFPPKPKGGDGGKSTNALAAAFPGGIQDLDDPQLGTLRSTLAEVIAQTLESGAAMDTDFTVVNAKGDFPSAEVLRERLAAL